MGFYDCTDCGTKVLFEEGFRPRRTTCFRCHVRSIRIGFSHGKEDFHGPTIRERQEQAVREAKEAGVDIAPVGSRWV